MQHPRPAVEIYKEIGKILKWNKISVEKSDKNTETYEMELNEEVKIIVIITVTLFTAKQINICQVSSLTICKFDV